MSGQFFHTAPRIFSSSSDYQSDKVRCWWTVFICQQSGFFVSANVATLLANEANLLAKKTTLLAKNCPLRRVLRVLTRLLHPQHLHGIWSGLMPYRLPFDTLGEYSEPWLQQTRISLSWTWGRNAVRKKNRVLPFCGLELEKTSRESPKAALRTPLLRCQVAFTKRCPFYYRHFCHYYYCQN